jgi:hypothetical protein
MIWPSQISIGQIDHEINEINLQIEEQKILLPVFNDVLKAEALLKNSPKFPFPKIADADENSVIKDADKISSVFEEIAEDNRLNIKNIQANFNSLTSDSKYLSVDITMAGNFFDLYNFLIRCGGIPYIEDIEELRILPDQETGGNIKEIGLKIWLKINN